jgi:glycolate dehydrogenase FAD-linked subunit
MNGVPGKALDRLRRALPAGELRFDPAALETYAADHWLTGHPPDAVCLPRRAESVSKILRLARELKWPVTARGAGYGYVGGCVPSRGGIVLSLERMNRIREINQDDFVAVVEAGVVTSQLQEAVEAKNLFYPPDPASRAHSTLGGNIANNAGGPRCLKYGVTRDYVLGLQVALADGSLVRLGGRTHKNKTGFDLHRLFVGSEGLLGIVTEATLKLLPLPPYRAALSVGYASMKSATRAIRAIFQAGLLPCALEVADQFTLAAARRRTGSRLLDGCQAHLIVELDGQAASVRHELKALAAVVQKFRPTFLLRALGADRCETIWQLRREFSFALRDTGLKKINEDIVVPRGRLEDLFIFTARLQKKYGLPVACFGHAGDGNIHVNVMVDEKDPTARARAGRAVDDLFDRVLAWNGVITGEHGIGLAKKKWWPQAVDHRVRTLHAAIKHALDPDHLLNPGKFV